jgi:hypothetical protein
MVKAFQVLSHESNARTFNCIEDVELRDMWLDEALYSAMGEDRKTDLAQR